MSAISLFPKWANWLCLAICLVACKKEEEVPPIVAKNSADILMNGKPWNDTKINTRTNIYDYCGYLDTSVLKEQYKNFFSIYFLRYHVGKNEERNYFEGMSFGAIPLKIGTYLLNGNLTSACRPDTIPAGSLHSNEYDVMTNYYVVLQSEKNYFRVNKVDKQTGLVEGEFMATFIRKDSAKGSTYPDTMRIQPSRFSAFIGAQE